MAIERTLLTLSICLHVIDSLGGVSYPRPVMMDSYDLFNGHPALKNEKLYKVDPWDVHEVTQDGLRKAVHDTKDKTLTASHSAIDAYDMLWSDSVPKSDMFPLQRKSRKRKVPKAERGVASIKPVPTKRVKNDHPMDALVGKENAVHGNQWNEKVWKNRIPMPLSMSHYKGINEINLLINGESIELHCGSPVYLPDFRESIEQQLHLSPDRDALGCVKFNRKPTAANVQHILAMVKSKQHFPHFEIRNGSVHDDAVVFERVKHVAAALAGGMDTFMQRVFYQKPWEYLNNAVEYRDYYENWHYRYFTRHMWFEVKLLEVLREYYPRQGIHNGPTLKNSGIEPPQDTSAFSDDFNISKHVDADTPRSEFQGALIAVLEKHLKGLPDPTRPSSKLDDHMNPLESVIAHAMYGQTKYIDEANVNELFGLIPKSLRKGYSRLQALHIVLHLAFRYALNARYLLFMEHSGDICMSAWEREHFITSFSSMQSMLNAENKFANTAPQMFRELMRFIEKSGCYQSTFKSKKREQ